MGIKFVKCVPIKDGEFFTIILRGDKDTDEISLIKMRNKPIRIIEEAKCENDTVAELLTSIRETMKDIDEKLKRLEN